MMPLLLLCLLCVGYADPTPAESADSSLFPPDGFEQTWNRSGRRRVFTSQDLYGYIDGGAEVFLEFGFEQLSVQSYIPEAGKSSNGIQVEIYRMTDPEAAAGVYLMKCGTESPDPALIERHTLNKFQLVFMRDRYFVIVNNLEGDDAIRPAVLEFARYIAFRLPPGAPVKAVGLLPKDGLLEGSIRLARGPYALQAIYTLGEGDILQLGRQITAVSANYPEPIGRRTLILVEYPDESAARSAFSNIGRNLDSYLKLEEKNDRGLIFKDYAGEYGLIRLAGKRLNVEVHLQKKPPSIP